MSEQNALTTDDLPEEMLALIMSHLPLFDRQRARLVCKRWNQVSYSYSLIKDDWLVVPSVPCLKKIGNLSPHWRFCNLRILEVGHKYEKADVWERFGPSIKNIELNVVSTHNPVLVDILNFCTDLRSLTLIDSVCPLTEGNSFAESTFFPLKLECLKFRNFCDVTDDEFNALTKNAEKLTQLYLPGAHYDWMRRVKISTVVSLLKRQSAKLTHLGFSADLDLSAFLEDSIIELFSTFGSQLKHLETTFKGGSRERCAQVISQTCPNLEVIDISSSEVDRKSLNTMFKSCKKVKKIKMHGMIVDNSKIVAIVHSNSLLVLDTLEFLREIDLSDCHINSRDLMWLAERPRQNIQVLIFNRIQCVDDDVLLKISPMVPNILHWSLDENHFGDIGFNAIVRNNKLLQHLSMNGCEKLRTIIPGINDLTELRTLNLGWCKNIAKSSIECLKLKNLKILRLDGLGINDNIEKTVKACPCLEHIYLGRPANTNNTRPA